jgi:alanyl-tRNA synthetase
MTTQRLYYNDSYMLNFSAHVVELAMHKDRPAVVLDQTYFYPEGGGQPSDLGTLNGIAVTDVQTRESDRAVLHVIDKPLIGSRIEGSINADRRRDYMHHHSGQHILSQALSQAANAQTVSVHMSADTMTIDVKRTNILPEEWIAVETLANQIISENRPVRAWFPEADELATLAIRKLPDVVGKVRIVDVGGFDITACGGTHVKQTGEIGLIKVIRFERRGDTTRLEFKCSGRAFQDYREKSDTLNRLAAQMTVGYWELGEAFSRLQDENKALKSEIKVAREQLITAEALALLPSVANIKDLQVVKQVFTDRSIDDLKLLVQKITEHPNTIALIGLAGTKAQLLFGRAENVATVDMSTLLKTALSVLKSERGGGRPNFAQGGGVSATQHEIENAIQVAAQVIS